MGLSPPFTEKTEQSSRKSIRPSATTGTRVKRRRGVEFQAAPAQARAKLPAGRTWDAVRPAGIFFCLLWNQCAAFRRREIWGCAAFCGRETKKKKMGWNWKAGPGFSLEEKLLGRRNVSRAYLVQQLAIFFFFLMKKFYKCRNLQCKIGKHNLNLLPSAVFLEKSENWGIISVLVSK